MDSLISGRSCGWFFVGLLDVEIDRAGLLSGLVIDGLTWRRNTGLVGDYYCADKWRRGLFVVSVGC